MKRSQALKYPIAILQRNGVLYSMKSYYTARVKLFKSRKVLKRKVVFQTWRVHTHNPMLLHYTYIPYVIDEKKRKSFFLLCNRLPF